MGSAAAAALVSWLASGLLSGVGALGAAGRIAPAFVVAVLALLVAEALGAGAFGVVAAVCVAFGCDFFFCAGADSAGTGSEPFQPTNRDTRSNMPSELDGSV